MSGGSTGKLFRHLNVFGWVLVLLIIPLAIGMIFNLWFFPWLESREPSVWRFGLEVVFLMIQVPLGYAAWKNVRRKSATYKWDRAAVAIWAFMSLAYVLESRFALQKGDTWRPHLHLMLLWTLIFAIHAWGRKSDPSALNSSALNNPAGMPRRTSGVI